MDGYLLPGGTNVLTTISNGTEFREVAHLSNSEGSRRCRRFWPPGNLPFNRDPYNGSLQSLWNWIAKNPGKKKKQQIKHTALIWRLKGAEVVLHSSHVLFCLEKTKACEVVFFNSLHPIQPHLPSGKLT